MPTISNSEEARTFLRSLTIYVDEAVVRRVLAVVTKESKDSEYSLYAHGLKRDETRRSPVCAKDTVRKIKCRHQSGELDPFVKYLEQRATAQDTPSDLQPVPEVARIYKPHFPPDEQGKRTYHLLVTSKDDVHQVQIEIQWQALKNPGRVLLAEADRFHAVPRGTRHLRGRGGGVLPVLEPRSLPGDHLPFRGIAKRHPPRVTHPGQSVLRVLLLCKVGVHGCP